MLLRLHVRNFAIIEALELELGPGFNVLTGETGAGKSILISALRLLLGDRAQSDLVRAGAPNAVVEGLFELVEGSEIHEKLAEYALLAESEDERNTLLIRRVVTREGRNKIFLNGNMGTLAMLRDIAEGLVDISGQHDHVSLLRKDRHVDMLDAFAGLTTQRRALGSGWRELRAAQEAWQALLDRDAAAERERDYLQFQLDELAALDPQAGELDALEEERRRLANAERIQQAAMSAESMLYSGDGAASELLGRAAEALRALAHADAELGQFAESLDEALGQVEDVAHELGRRARSSEGDDARLAELEDRVAEYRRLIRKHGGEEAAMLARYAELHEQLEDIDGADARRTRTGEALQSAFMAFDAGCRKLSKARRSAARKFQRAVQAELESLGMDGVRFEVSIESLIPAAPADLRETAVSSGLSGYAVHGGDRVQFLIATNAGEEARELGRIASGGELSRVLLAIKRVFAATDPVGCYVFDEIDTGVGGRIANVVGEKLADVGAAHQVVCITHLPQIASRADRQFAVSKASKGGRAVSQVRRLNDEERAQELATMLGGEAEPSLALAQEMLRRAR